MLAVLIMDGILARGLEADYITWNSVISACESGSQWAQALRMLHRARLCFVADPSGMPQNLKRGTNSVISSCGKASRWPLGIQLLRVMREDGPDGDMEPGQKPARHMDILCFNSLLLQMNGAHWKIAACLLQEMMLLNLSSDLTTYRGCTAVFQEGACHSRFWYQIAQSALELPRALRCVERFRQEEHAIEVALTASRLRGLHCLPLHTDRMIQRVVEAPARASLSLLSHWSAARLPRTCFCAFVMLDVQRMTSSTSCAMWSDSVIVRFDILRHALLNIVCMTKCLEPAAVLVQTLCATAWKLEA